MQKRVRKSSKNNGTFARSRRTRAARAGLVGPRQLRPFQFHRGQNLSNHPL